MRSSTVRKDDFSRYRLLKEVFDGNYPEEDVDKMSVTVLEAFVLRLVQFTSKAGAKTVSSIDVKNKPKWWPTDVLIKNPSDSLDSTTETEFHRYLRRLVITCSAFFREYKQKWLPPTTTKSLWKNDENFAKGEKRKIQDNSHINKRRKTLLPVENKSWKNGLQSQNTPYICLSRYSPVETSKDLTFPSKSEFLRIFKLSLNNNSGHIETEVPNSSRVIKLQNCPHIPISSDVGKLMLQRENHNLPDYARDRKLERLEWYINKDIPLNTKQKYEINFSTSKCSHSHIYIFPKKQYHQLHGNPEWLEFLKRKCSPLKIVLSNDNLFSLKSHMDSIKVKVKVPRIEKPLLGVELGKKLCNISSKTPNKNYKSTPQKEPTSLLPLKELRVVLFDYRRRAGLRAKKINKWLKY